MGIDQRYGYTLDYGDGAYKGELADSPNSLSGLAWAATRRCFHLGFNRSQGLGWAEITDNDWVWPESQAAVMHVFDENGLEQLVVFDEKSGLPYCINTRNAPASSNMALAVKDKFDPCSSGSGTDVDWYVKLPEERGESMNFDVEHEQSRLHFRPIDNANRGATGYDSDGLPSSLSIDVSLYQDGSTTAIQTMDSVPIDSEMVFDRQGRGETLQIKIAGDKGGVRLIEPESDYKAIEVFKMPSKGNMTEAAYELAMQSPVLWLSRSSTLLKDRCTGTALSGTAAATTGPDGFTNSAMNISVAVSLANAAIATGVILLWSTTEYNITGLSLATYTSKVVGATTWYVRRATGAIGANLSLGTGVVFDVRLFDEAVATAAIDAYVSDVVNNDGKVYLPNF